VGIRYGFLDLQDKGVNGATLHDIVLGLNWFLNPNTKVQWNLAIDHRESTPAGSSGWTYIFGTRLALDFCPGDRQVFLAPLRHLALSILFHALCFARVCYSKAGFRVCSVTRPHDDDIA